jgi:uncharacterized protein YecE (DUF72 family)
MWANRRWNGRFFLPKTKQADFLQAYSSVFTTVEGNTTFYAVPKKETLAKWAQDVPEDFRFCFKFPRAISHDRPLRDGVQEAARFISHFEALSDNLGPFFLQLPERFDDLAALEHFLQRLPAGFAYAVEVRSRRFFDRGQTERGFCDLLDHLQVDRVIFDSRALMVCSDDTPGVTAAKQKKPKAPVRYLAHGQYPMLRFVGHPQLGPNAAVLGRWADVVAHWIREGRRPYVFMHQVPEDDEAPIVAHYFHQLLRMRIPDLKELPAFPLNSFQPPVKESQLSLFADDA